MKPVVEMASESEDEYGNKRESSSADPDPEAEVVGGNEVGREEERARGEVAAAGQGNLIGKGDIRHASDKMEVGVHGGQAPSEGLPEEGGYEKTD